MTEHVRVLVIGGGAVGCSCLYHLAGLGWTDALLLERDELTAGSTWHAAGNVPTFSTTPSIMRLQHYSARLYARLADAVGYPIAYHVTGSVRLSHNAARLDEYRLAVSRARALGIDYELLDPSGLKRRYELVETAGLNGALWDPLDGDIDPAQLTQALAKGARDRGARVRRATRVTGLRQAACGAWHVATDQGEIVAEIVVNAAGYRAGEVMRLLGQDLPAVVMSHQYLVTEEAPELRARGARLPLLRDPDVSYYLRQEGHGFILGPYEAQATPMWREGIPEDFAYALWDDDLARLEPYVEAACARVPPLGRAGVRRVVNGPIPYTPDGLPYIGPAHGISGFFHCNTFSFGIAQAGGAGKALAEWVVEGAPEWDLWAADPRRYTGYATKSFVLAKAVELYRLEYAPAFPREERPAGRPLRASPLHDRLAARGAQFGVRGGWETPLWFGAPDREAPLLSFRRRRPWSAAVAAEVRALREAAGLIERPGLAKFLLAGPEAAAMLDRLLCTRLPRPGRVRLGYALDARGRIVSEFTLARLGPDRFYLCAVPEAEWHDADLLRAALPPAGAALEDLTCRNGTLLLAGPAAAPVLAAAIGAEAADLPPFAARETEIGAARLLLLRLGGAGAPGFELHVPFEHLAAVEAALWRAGAAHGLRDVGLFALESLRLDRGLPGWQTELSRDVSPFEAGLGRFVDLAKPDFIGRASLLAERARGAARLLRALVLRDAGDADAPPGAAVFADGTRVGEVTTGGFSDTLGRSVALAYLRADHAASGAVVQVDVFGAPRAATVAEAPVFDPVRSRPHA